MHGVPDIVDDSDYQDFEKYLFKLAEQDNSATDHSGQVGSRKDCALQCEVQSLELLEPVNGRQHLPTADHYTSHEKKKSSRKATNSQQHFSLQRKFHGGCICKPLRKVLLQSFFKSVEFIRRIASAVDNDGNLVEIQSTLRTVAMWNGNRSINERKREQNRSAAVRYREKRREEIKRMRTELFGLELRNVQLKTEMTGLIKEIDYLKTFLLSK
ncbi:unnamed protein product [Dracunculus medinensis]|uniref:BZIP domain-containing protein n=1 Tax=Dracunculus medinensis TaxID=318479 RepID=A0A0N4U0Q0_DRAME|nr:unnamed protein product [Dracunculus medinensis]